jgi:hypothetical protein
MSGLLREEDFCRKRCSLLFGGAQWTSPHRFDSLHLFSPLWLHYIVATALSARRYPERDFSERCCAKTSPHSPSRNSSAILRARLGETRSYLGGHAKKDGEAEGIEKPTWREPLPKGIDRPRCSMNSGSARGSSTVAPPEKSPAHSAILWARFLAAWQEQVQGDQLFSEASFNLDFHSVPFYGEDPIVERHSLSARSRRQPSMLVFLAHHAEGRAFCYSNADLRKGEESEEIFQFVSFWKRAHGTPPRQLVFDSRLRPMPTWHAWSRMVVPRGRDPQ